MTAIEKPTPYRLEPHPARVVYTHKLNGKKVDISKPLQSGFRRPEAIFLGIKPTYFVPQAKGAFQRVIPEEHHQTTERRTKECAERTLKAHVPIVHVISPSLKDAASFKPETMRTRRLADLFNRCSVKERNSLIVSGGEIPGFYLDVTFNNLAANRYDFKSRKKLGMGADGAVYLVEDRTRSEKVGIKINREANGLRHLLNELKETCRVQGLPHVIQLLNFFAPNTNHIVLIFENIGPDLFTNINLRETEKRNYKLDDIALFLDMLFESLSALHENSCAHLDLKPSNMHFSVTNKTFKIFDFGNAVNPHKERADSLGTACYSSPEQCLEGNVSFPSDIYSAGCIVYELFSLQNLFSQPTGDLIENQNRVKLSGERAIRAKHLQEIIQLFGPFPPSLIAEGAASHFFFAINRDGRFLFDTKPGKSLRMLFEEANKTRKDPPEIVALLIDLAEKMLHPDPKKRITAEDARKHPFLQAFRTKACVLPTASAKPKLVPTPPTTPKPVGVFTRKHPSLQKKPEEKKR